MSNSLEHPVFLSQVGKLSTWMTQRGERQGSASREEQWLGHNWENICIGLFHVSGHLDNFARYLFLVNKNNVGGMGII